jgi:hypothetical protein
MFHSSFADLEILWDASSRSTYPALASSTLGLKFGAYEIFLILGGSALHVMAPEPVNTCSSLNTKAMHA